MIKRWQILEGDVRELLVDVDEASVDCVVTRPPYWGLRDYGAGAKQIGLEASLEEHLEIMVSVFEQVRRALKPTGTLWLNLGDTYMASRKGPAGASSLLVSRRNSVEALKLTGIPRRARGLKKKDLVGLPWRIAFALQAAGWWLRCDVIWEKPTVTPESVNDRPTREHEYVFLLSKSAKYFYDKEAIAEPCSPNTHERCKAGLVPKSIAVDSRTHRGNESFAGATKGRVAMRNARSVWSIPQVPEKEEHTATFPPELARRCILAGCPAGGLVLDPFAGLATTGRAALGAGRRFVGIELNPKYAALARERCVEALERRGEATIEDAQSNRGPMQMGLLANGSE